MNTKVLGSFPLAKAATGLPRAPSYGWQRRWEALRTPQPCGHPLQVWSQDPASRQAGRTRLRCLPFPGAMPSPGLRGLRPREPHRNQVPAQVWLSSLSSVAGIASDSASPLSTVGGLWAGGPQKARARSL